MTCQHKTIRTFVFVDTGEPCGLWSCADCGLRFEPITNSEWVGLTDEDWNRSKHSHDFQKGVDWAQAMLKEKNT